jgi:hypothetical protein
MSTYLPQHAAIAATNDKHMLGAGMRKQRHVNDHFLVGKFIPLG